MFGMKILFDVSEYYEKKYCQLIKTLSISLTLIEGQHWSSAAPPALRELCAA